MNKTLALIAALGLVISVPAFAADEGATTSAAPAVSDTGSAKDITKAEKKEIKKHSRLSAREKAEKSKEAKDATKANPKADSDLAPAAGGAEKSSQQ